MIKVSTPISVPNHSSQIIGSCQVNVKWSQQNMLVSVAQKLRPISTPPNNNILLIITHICPRHQAQQLELLHGETFLGLGSSAVMGQGYNHVLSIPSTISNEVGVGVNLAKKNMYALLATSTEAVFLG